MTPTEARIAELERMLSVLKSSTAVTLSGKGGAYEIMETRLSVLRDVNETGN